MFCNFITGHYPNAWPKNRDPPNWVALLWGDLGLRVPFAVRVVFSSLGFLTELYCLRASCSEAQGCMNFELTTDLKL